MNNYCVVTLNSSIIWRFWRVKLVIMPSATAIQGCGIIYLSKLPIFEYLEGMPPQIPPFSQLLAISTRWMPASYTHPSDNLIIQPVIMPPGCNISINWFDLNSHIIINLCIIITVLYLQYPFMLWTTALDVLWFSWKLMKLGFLIVTYIRGNFRQSTQQLYYWDSPKATS